MAAPLSLGGSSHSALTVFVIGASGDLAHKKTYPALFDLFTADLLPKHTLIVGYARSAIEDAAFQAGLKKHLKGSEATVAEFLGRCIYRHGAYDDKEAFGKVRRCQGLLEGIHRYRGVCQGGKDTAGCLNALLMRL